MVGAEAVRMSHSGRGRRGGDGLAEVRRWFFERHLVLEPEDATALGVRSLDDRLRDLSPEGRAVERSFLEEAAERLASIGLEALEPSDRLDHEVMNRQVRTRLQAMDWGTAFERNLELVLLPHAAIQRQLSRARAPAHWRALIRRLTGCAPFLVEQIRNLERGARRGLLPGRLEIDAFVRHNLPAVQRALGELPSLPDRCGVELEVSTRRALEQATAQACDGYAKLSRFLEQRLLPAAPELAVIGREEYCHRLREGFAVDEELESLVARAERELVELQEQIIAHADRLGARTVTDLEGARELILELQSEHLEEAEEIVPYYRSIFDEVAEFVRAKKLFELESGYLVPLLPTPEAVGDAHGNWPAPLLDRDEEGFFLVSPQPAAHSRFWGRVLAVHEGAPGHHLQSWTWQQRFSFGDAPVRFLRVADDVAAARPDWAPMLNIEGYAVYVEELMRREGFFRGTDALAVLLSHAIRAVRVIVDVRLQLGEMTPAEAGRFVADNSCMPVRWGEAQVVRHLRIPTQAITYALGRWEIELLAELRRELERGGGFDEARFHRDLLALGPVPPALARPLFAGGGEG